MLKLNKKGFTLVELLVVLVIIGILAAVATPLYLQHTKRAKVSEAIATMGLIRQALRDYKVNHNSFFDVTQKADDGNIQLPLPTGIADAATGKPDPEPSGVDVNAGVTQYFSNSSFFVDAGGTGGLGDKDGASGLFKTPDAVDFIISAKGDNSDACDSATDDNCAIHNTDVAGYQVEMDNSGRIFACYGTCSTAANWSAY